MTQSPETGWNPYTPAETNRQEAYLAVLQRAKAMETEAVKTYLQAILLAPPEDVIRLIEIANDETDHEAILSDLDYNTLANMPTGDATP